MPRRVIRSDLFLEQATRAFPVDGSTDGRPSFELFETTILKSIEFAFGQNFEDQLPAWPGSPVRVLFITQTPYFERPLVVYALLAESNVVELVGVEQDDEWLDDNGGDV